MGARGVVAGEEPRREMEVDPGTRADEKVVVVVEEEVQIEKEENQQR